MTKPDRGSKMLGFPRKRPSLIVDVCGPIFVMYWHASPTLDDVIRVLDDAHDARMAYGKAMLQLVLLTEASFTIPAGPVRSAMSENMQEMDENFDGYVLVLGGLGFVAAAIHALSSTLILAGGRKPGRTKICRSEAEAVQALVELSGTRVIDEAALRQTLRGLAALAAT
jgi:hypothetical protein